MLRELSRSHPRLQMYLDTSVRVRSGSAIAIGGISGSPKGGEAYDRGERFAFRPGCMGDAINAARKV
jgi:hypothetical protein